ncbi:MAG: bifunctional oligoribonuclease/PAP phosphatase NrnA [Spirochaetales bacterium]|nr:bifunctional oligoribonuclease/PAP phosphatase NrnA [Spirochaetales bacterium]
MNSPDIAPILGALLQHTDIIILGHEDPDADCLGSQKALGLWLQHHGKTVHLCSAGPWRRPEILPWQGDFSNQIPQALAGKAITVILDCSSYERTGFPESSLPDTSMVVIDHHASGQPFGDLRWIEPTSPSTTMMVQRLIEASGDALSPEMAEALFLGFCTDTGFFRHLEPHHGWSLEAVARLLDAGASPPEAFRAINGGRSLGSRKLLGRALDRIELYFDGRVAITWENWKDWKEVGTERDSDKLYQSMLGIQGVEAAFLIREQNDGQCLVGLRSVTDLDVAEIARFFGGGGHKKASGCMISGDLNDAIEHLTQILATRLKA